MKTATTPKRLALIGTTILLALGGAAQAATQSSTIRITLRKPVTITLLRDLDFGRIIATGAAGTVLVNPDSGARSVSGGPVLAGGSPQTGRFRIVATPATLVLITRSALPVLTRASGGGTMPVTLITMSGAVNPVTAPASGTFDVDIGGALSVGANQADGAYSGTFQINANYQ